MTIREKPKALFLDRDGVINIDRNYVHRIEDFTFVAGIFELVSQACDLGMSVIVVTNQSGIGRGYYDDADFQTLTQWMIQKFSENNGRIDRVYHCPYHPDAINPTYRKVHPWRKPAPGMLLQAQEDFDLDMRKSVLVGDNWTDIAAAAQADVKTTFLLGSPPRHRSITHEPTHQIDNLSEATQWLLANATQDPRVGSQSPQR